MSDESTPGTGPARGYSWPPAEPGNLLAVKHGAHSERLLAELIPESGRELREALVESGVAPYLLRADDLALDQAARAIAQFRRVENWLQEQDPPGLIDARGRPRPAAKLWVSLQHLMNRHLSALGLTPVARAELMASMTGAKLDQARSAAAELQAKYGRRPKPVEPE